MAEKEPTVIQPSWIVPQEGEGARVDRWLSDHYGTPITRSSLQRAIVDGKILINGLVCKANQRLRAQDTITALERPPEVRVLTPCAMPLDVLYEDDYVLVLNKPAGITVHPGAGTTQPTLIEGVLAYVDKMESQPRDLRPGVVHRLDRDTTGVMVFAKTAAAHLDLSKQFHDKTNERTYIAILDGNLAWAPSTWESYLHRDPHNRVRFASTPREEVESRFSIKKIPSAYRLAKTLFTPTAYFGHSFTEVEAQLFTGRTHQIRVHAQLAGAAVLGDPLYQRKRMYPKTFPPAILEAITGLKRQMLHATRLGFFHPESREWMSFEAPVPHDFANLLSLLEPFRRKGTLPTHKTP